MIPALIGAGAMIGSALINNSRRKKASGEAKELAELNYQYSQLGAEAAHARQIELYNKQFNNEMMTSNPAFQAARLRAAGFNPAMMFSSNQSGLGVSMPNAARGEPLNAHPYTSRTSLADILNIGASQALNFSMLKAQKENIEAQTEKTIAETKTKIPVEAAATEASIQETFERIQNSRIQRDGQRLENEFNEIRNSIAKATHDDDIQRIKNETLYSVRQIQYITEEIFRARRENEIGDETMETAIKSAFAQLQNIYVDTNLKNAEIQLKGEQTSLTTAQRQNLTDVLNLKWEELHVNEYVQKRGQDSTIWGTIRETITNLIGTPAEQDRSEHERRGTKPNHLSPWK